MNSADLAAPSEARSEHSHGLRRAIPDLVGVAVVCAVMLVGYWQVPFAGKTFSTASYVAGTDACGSATRECEFRGKGDPRPDLGASAWQLEPWAQVTHRAISRNEVPLWNPYQGIGTPLAADLPTGAFDPLMVGILRHPTAFVADLSTIAWLLLIALSAYLSARILRMRAAAATVTGVAYGLSGWFVSYSNNWFFRAYLFLPLLIAMIEWTIRSKRRLPVALLGVSMAGSFLVGMPELTFMSLAAAGLFALGRLVVGECDGARVMAALRLVGGAALGVALAAPAIVPAQEYLSRAFTTHSFTGDPPATNAPNNLLNWMAPKLTQATYPTFDNRQWIGAAVVLLAVVALFHTRSMRRHSGWPLVLSAGVIGFQIYGGRLVGWTGELPGWSQVAWTRLGTPALALPVALLAGIGVQTVADRAVERRRVFAALGVFGGLSLLLLVTDQRALRLLHGTSFRGGWMLALLTVTLVAAILLLRPSLALGIAIIVIVELLLLMPYGIYAERGDLYPTRPWLAFLQGSTRDHSRVFSTQGILYPDVASVYGLSDPRVLDAINPARYLDYLKAFVSPVLVDRFTGIDPNESAPKVAANPMFDLLGVRYLVYYDSVGSGPPPGSEAQFRLAYRGDGVKIYENLRAAPRAFVVHDVRPVDDAEAAATLMLTNKTFDPRTKAVIEAGPDEPRLRPCAGAAPSTATITSYAPSKVRIKVTSRCPGLLVLADQYFPGWSASVDGKHADVYATDATLRGVRVPAGTSTVELNYRPASFRNGMILFAIGLLTLLVLAVQGVRASPWWRAGRRRD